MSTEKKPPRISQSAIDEVAAWARYDEEQLALARTPSTDEVRDAVRSWEITPEQFDHWLKGQLARARTEITVTDEMVERVAAAMLEETYGHGAWDSREPMEDVLYRRRARVAIAATLETNHTIRSQEES